MISFQDPSPSIDLPSADRPFDNIINFRDVGKSVNGYLGKVVMKEGVLFRSARPDDASERDLRRLSEELRVSTVIDLRSESEHNLAREKSRGLAHGDSQGQDQAQDQAQDQDEGQGQTDEKHLVNIPGANRVSISLTGKSFERALLWRLDWMTFFKVISLSATGYRHDAVKTVIQQAMAPRGLTGLAMDTLDASTVEIKEVFSVLAGYHPDEDENEWYYDTTTKTDEHADTDAEKIYPLLIHCTQGKDRTGLIILLVLLLVLDDFLDSDRDFDRDNDLNNPDDNDNMKNAVNAVNADYTRSEAELTPEAEDRLQELRYMGIPESFLLCPREFTAVVRGYLNERYGGVMGYLEGIGVGREMRDCVRGGLLV